MKLRRDKIEVTDSAEQEAADDVRRLGVETRSVEFSAPSDTYFANLLVKTNQKIDAATSGKALSISWLARVAVPGVVAILFFFIGLHYYSPELMNGRTSFTETIKALSPGEFDSLMAYSITKGELAENVQTDMFDVSREQLAEYFVSSGNETVLLESLPEYQLDEVAAILETKTNL